MVRADKLEARESAHTWAAVQKRGAMTLQKKLWIGWRDYFFYDEAFFHIISTLLLLQSHPMLSIGRGKAPAVLHPCLGQTHPLHSHQIPRG